MADPNDPDSLPTQQWSGSDDAAPSPAPRLSDSAIEGMLGARNPHTRGGWQPPTPEELQARLPQYEITELLGRGGMGAVYKGWQKSLERFVAIKILPPEIESGDVDFAARFKREAKSMARLKHPGIIHVHDAGGTADGLLYFVMDYVEGTDVQKMVAARGRLPAEEALGITAHVLDALAYAHQHGIIHRDIKPANIMVDAEGHVHVADFGLARSTAADSTMLTASNMAMGTPDFMAPESQLGMDHVDHRADLYAVGVMLYQMLTGKLPRGRFEPPSRAVPGLDKRLDRIMDRALQPERDARYSSAIELRAELDPVLTRTLARRDSAPGASPARSRASLWIGIAAVLLVLGGAVFHFGKAKPPRAAAPSAPDHVRGNATPAPAASIAPAWQKIHLPDYETLKARRGAAITPAGELITPSVIRVLDIKARNIAIRGELKRLPDVNTLMVQMRKWAKDDAEGSSWRHFTLYPADVWLQSARKGLQFTTLSRSAYPPSVDPTRWTPFEFAVIEDASFVMLGGVPLLPVGHSPEAQEAGAVNLAGGQFRNLEYINLDGLPEAEALRLAAPQGNRAEATPGPPVEPWRDWIAELRGRGSFKNNRVFEDDASQVRVRSNYDLVLADDASARNGAVRVVWTWLADSTPSLKLRNLRGATGEPVREYQAKFDSRTIKLLIHDYADKDDLLLREWNYPDGFDRTAEHTCEFRVVDDLLSVRLDGREIGSWRDRTIDQPGMCVVGLPGGTALRELQTLRLDPTSPTELSPKP